MLSFDHTAHRYDPNPREGPPRGEILIRGPGLFKGYYRDDSMTQDVIGGCALIVIDCHDIGGCTLIDRDDCMTQDVIGGYAINVRLSVPLSSTYP